MSDRRRLTLNRLFFATGDLERDATWCLVLVWVFVSTVCVLRSRDTAGARRKSDRMLHQLNDRQHTYQQFIGRHLLEIWRTICVINDIWGPILTAMMQGTRSRELIYCRASACNVCRARYCYGKSVRRSVCPMPVLCLNEWAFRHIFWRPGMDIILVFEPRRRYKIQGEPPQRGIKYTGVGEFCQRRFLSRKRYDIGPCSG